jgi:mRNA degradation ribonuclease J1/J2
VLAKARDAILNELGSREGPCEAAVVKQAMRTAVRRVVREETRLNPVVVPVVLEI